MRNALPPIATISGLQLGYLLGGALFTEVVFAWPGLGNQLYYAIAARDVPVVQGAVLLIALVFVLVNLVIDILNAFLDPRVRAVVRCHDRDATTGELAEATGPAMPRRRAQRSPMGGVPPATGRPSSRWSSCVLVLLATLAAP